MPPEMAYVDTRITFNKRPMKRRPRSPGRRPLISTSGLVVVLMICLLQESIFTHHVLLSSELIVEESSDDTPKEGPGWQPYFMEAGFLDSKELPFISTITEIIHPRSPKEEIPMSFYQLLERNHCLPDDHKCNACLRNQEGANCETCAVQCHCYCKTLCQIPVEELPVSKSISVQPPSQNRDKDRLVPRIIHQTWFEKITPAKYPNMSRLMESFKQSGWDYKFYTDEDSVKFLTTHFPSEIREAYEALKPGAFKADLFRYCVLLIHGGVYADLDVMLEANLDFGIPADVGFMVPLDEPGKSVDHRMCLWNGFMASAPGHPFLAKAIEMVVNAARNRFTGVDFDHMFCPDPELSVLHAFDILFQAGPCMLGSAINNVLGRDGMTSFVAGSTLVSDAVLEESVATPGKTVFLEQNKHDMGAQRFTYLERNMVLAATDFPDDDRSRQANPSEHYSKSQPEAGIYGLKKVYIDRNRANEDIRFLLAASPNTWTLNNTSLEASNTTLDKT